MPPKSTATNNTCQAFDHALAETITTMLVEDPDVLNYCPAIIAGAEILLGNDPRVMRRRSRFNRPMQNRINAIRDYLNGASNSKGEQAFAIIFASMRAIATPAVMGTGTTGQIFGNTKISSPMTVPGYVYLWETAVKMGVAEDLLRHLRTKPQTVAGQHSQYAGHVMCGEEALAGTLKQSDVISFIAFGLKKADIVPPPASQRQPTSKRMKVVTLKAPVNYFDSIG